MDSREMIQKLKQDLSSLQTQKQEFVSIPALKNHLDALELHAISSSETQKLLHVSNLEWYRAQQEMNREMFRSVIDAGSAAVKSSLLINGGASVALLAFIGNIGAKGHIPNALLVAIASFCIGVLTSAMAMGARYLSQHCYAHNLPAWANPLRYVSIGLVIVAYLAFGFGIYCALSAFT